MQFYSSLLMCGFTPVAMIWLRFIDVPPGWVKRNATWLSQLLIELNQITVRNKEWTIEFTVNSKHYSRIRDHSFQMIILPNLNTDELVTCFDCSLKFSPHHDISWIQPIDLEASRLLSVWDCKRIEAGERHAPTDFGPERRLNLKKMVWNVATGAFGHWSLTS